MSTDCHPWRHFPQDVSDRTCWTIAASKSVNVIAPIMHHALIRNQVRSYCTNVVFTIHIQFTNEYKFHERCWYTCDWGGIPVSVKAYCQCGKPRWVNMSLKYPRKLSDIKCQFSPRSRNHISAFWAGIPAIDTTEWHQFWRSIRFHPHKRVKSLGTVNTQKRTWFCIFIHEANFTKTSARIELK